MMMSSWRHVKNISKLFNENEYMLLKRMEPLCRKKDCYLFLLWMGKDCWLLWFIFLQIYRHKRCKIVFCDKFLRISTQIIWNAWRITWKSVWNHFDNFTCWFQSKFVEENNEYYKRQQLKTNPEKCISWNEDCIDTIFARRLQKVEAKKYIIYFIVFGIYRIILIYYYVQINKLVIK